MPKNFNTVLIANRGAIARRIARSCRELGYKTVMIYTATDCHPELLSLADQVFEVESYQNAEAIVALAKPLQAAIHPGYGFLAEDPAFARACLDAGLVWIGPSPGVLALSGDKTACATALRAAGLPLLPSLPCSDAEPETLVELQGLGLPLLLKPAHGGGGIGMRLVHEPADLGEALSACLDQAMRHFGVGSVLAEHWLPAARHIEVQLLADSQGQIVTLFERDCSLQRRRQKVVEEGPSPALNPAQRESLYALARTAARTIGLDQVATAEFLFDGTGFWFLEINPRLQVEHAVTEALTGLDLVEWQLRIAQGESIEPQQWPSAPQGHAIEARLYAEHPWSGLPAAGDVYQLRLPDGHGLRLELGVYAGMRVSSDFDPLLMKLIAHGPDRPRALARLHAALQALELSGNGGFASNLPALCRILADPDFVAGHYHTASLEAMAPAEPDTVQDPALTQLIQTLDALRRRPVPQASQDSYWRPAWMR